MTEDISRLYSTIERLFDKVETTNKKSSDNEVLIKTHLGESEVRIKTYDSEIDSLKTKVEVLEKFRDLHEGSDNGRRWWQTTIQWLISIILAIWLLIEKFGGLLASRNN